MKSKLDEYDNSVKSRIFQLNSGQFGFRLSGRFYYILWSLKKLNNTVTGAFKERQTVYHIKTQTPGMTLKFISSWHLRRRCREFWVSAGPKFVVWAGIYAAATFGRPAVFLKDQ